MAKMMIDKIIEAEDKANEIVSNAEKQAKQILSDAENKAVTLSDSVKSTADTDAQKIINDAKTDADAIKTASERKAWAEGEKLSAIADRSRETAVLEAVKIILG